MNFKTTVEREKEATTKRFFEQFTSDGEILVDEDGTLTPWISHFIEQEVEKAMTNAVLAVVEEIERELKEANEGVPRSEYESGFDYGLDVALKLVTTLKASLTTKE